MTQLPGPPILTPLPSTKRGPNYWVIASLVLSILSFLLSFIFFVPVPTNLIWCSFILGAMPLAVVGWSVARKTADSRAQKLAGLSVFITCSGVVIIAITAVILSVIGVGLATSIIINLLAEWLPPLFEWIAQLWTP